MFYKIFSGVGQECLDIASLDHFDGILPVSIWRPEVIKFTPIVTKLYIREFPMSLITNPVYFFQKTKWRKVGPKAQKLVCSKLGIYGSFGSQKPNGGFKMASGSSKSNSDRYGT